MPVVREGRHHRPHREGMSPLTPRPLQRAGHGCTKSVDAGESVARTKLLGKMCADIVNMELPAAFWLSDPAAANRVT